MPLKKQTAEAAYRKRMQVSFVAAAMVYAPIIAVVVAQTPRLAFDQAGSEAVQISFAQFSIPAAEPGPAVSQDASASEPKDEAPDIEKSFSESRPEDLLESAEPIEPQAAKLEEQGEDIETMEPMNALSEEPAEKPVQPDAEKIPPLTEPEPEARRIKRETETLQTKPPERVETSRKPAPSKPQTAAATQMAAPKPHTAPKPQAKEKASPAGGSSQASEMSDASNASTSKVASVQASGKSAGATAVYGESSDPFLSEVMQRVRRELRYPNRARARGWSGETLLEVDIRGDGTIAEMRILKSAGKSILDDAAVNAVERAAEDWPKPSGPIKLRFPVRFDLQNR